MEKHGKDKPHKPEGAGHEAAHGDNLSARVHGDQQAEAQRKLEGKARPGAAVPETVEDKWASSLANPERYIKSVEELVKNHSFKQLEHLQKDVEAMIALAEKRIPELPKLLATAQAHVEKDLKPPTMIS